MRAGIPCALLLFASAALGGDAVGYEERVARAYSLGEGEDEAVAELVSFLDDESAVVRATAAASLGRIGPDAADAVDALRGRLSDRHVRCAAAKALARIAPERADVAGEIVALLFARSDFVREEAVRALAIMGPAAVRPLLAVRCSRTAVRRGRDAAVRALGRLGRRSVRALVAALADPDRSLRWAAILSIGDLGRDALAAEGALLTVAAGEDRWNAVWARCSLVLVTESVEPHLSAIREALRSEDEWSVAVQAIVRLGPRGGAAVPDLLRMLDEEDRDRRYQAAVALGSLGAAGRPALEELIRRDRRSVDPDPYVRDAIRNAIQSLAGAR